ncbi:MAG: hypothetical protein AAFX81_04555 [Pseudomonadota bacterium]
MRGLKLFVVTAAVLLLVGTAGFVYLFLAKRDNDRAVEVDRREGPAQSVATPANSRIVDLRFADGHALLVLEDDGGKTYLMLVDMDEGERVSLVALE